MEIKTNVVKWDRDGDVGQDEDRLETKKENIR